MAYDLSEINFKTVSDPRGLIEEGDAIYHANVETAAEKIADNIKNSPIVLLSGPSGSGKTTTAMKVSEALERRGFLVPAIRYPTVARGEARLRVAISARHTKDQLSLLAECIACGAETADLV